MLKRAYITEKSMGLTRSNFYTFVVSKAMTKLSVAKLVKNRFGVDVLSVRMLNTPSKRKLQRSRKGYFTRAGIKKALVEIKKGQKIALFEQEKEPEVKVKTAETPEVKEKKSVLKGSKVKVEKVEKKDQKTKTAKQKSIEKKKGAK
jgi:ribosomal protein L23